MKLWELRPAGFSDPDAEYPEPWSSTVWDCAYGFVVRAETEQRARELAESRAGFESNVGLTGSEAWLDSSLTTCEELSAEGSEMVVIRDYHAG